MFRVIMALGLMAAGVAPVGTQTPVVRPLPAATMARIRIDAQRLREEFRRERPATARLTFAPRPPKVAPAR